MHRLEIFKSHDFCYINSLEMVDHIQYILLTIWIPIIQSKFNCIYLEIYFNVASYISMCWISSKFAIIYFKMDNLKANAL